MPDIAEDNRYEEMLRYLGYRGQVISAELEEQLKEAFLEAENVSRPRAAFGEFSLVLEEEGIRLSGTSLVLTGEDIKEHLSGAEKAILLAVTLGTSAERALQQTEKRDMLRAVMLDSALSAQIEYETDRVEKQLVEKAEKEGYVTNWRYSPGYGDLPLELQKKIGEVLQLSRNLGVTVTENNLMIPRKTVTAVIGLFRSREERKGKTTGCQVCPLKGDCECRRWGRTCGRG